jgi:hypothetical protein
MLLWQHMGLLLLTIILLKTPLLHPHVSGHSASKCAQHHRQLRHVLFGQGWSWLGFQHCQGSHTVAGLPFIHMKCTHQITHPIKIDQINHAIPWCCCCIRQQRCPGVHAWARTCMVQLVSGVPVRRPQSEKGPGPPGPPGLPGPGCPGPAPPGPPCPGPPAHHRLHINIRSHALSAASPTRPFPPTYLSRGAVHHCCMMLCFNCRC